MITPEYKVKRFLDSIAYCLLLGKTDGIETDYKRVMHARREIPASSCPSYIENAMYASGGASGQTETEELEAFRTMVARLDERAEQYKTNRPHKTQGESRFEKLRRLGISGGEWCRVDTEGKFRLGNEQYIISDRAPQYQPVTTEYGDYYAMDRILCADGKFYDMNYDEVAVHKIGGWLPYESWQVGQETV